jgi:hypothetical protein
MEGLPGAHYRAKQEEVMGKKLIATVAALVTALAVAGVSPATSYQRFTQPRLTEAHFKRSALADSQLNAHEVTCYHTSMDGPADVNYGAGDPTPFKITCEVIVLRAGGAHMVFAVLRRLGPHSLQVTWWRNGCGYRCLISRWKPIHTSWVL